MKAFRRFLGVSDIHIGDAALAQSTLTAIHDFSPDAEIDYVINKMVAQIIERNPDATRIVPFPEPDRRLVFFGATTPRMSGYDSIRPGFLPSNQTFILQQMKSIREGRRPRPCCETR